MSVLIENPMAFNLTAQALRAIGSDPLIAGDYRRLRLQYRRDGVAIPLTSGQMIFSVRKADTLLLTDLMFRRDSAEPIAGWATDPFQIAFDTDQTVETGNTGRGWYDVIFTPPDETVLAAIADTRFHYDVRFMPSGGQEKTVLRGTVEFLLPRTETGAF